jgi:putative membrane protein
VKPPLDADGTSTAIGIRVTGLAPHEELPRMKKYGSLGVLVVTAVVCSIWSFAGAQERDIWFFELVPGAIGVCALVVLARWFRFSDPVYLMIAVAFVFIATGARYTYSEVPVAHRLSEKMDLSRNHFDRVGHFVQGLTVGLMTREVLRRRTTLGRRVGVPLLSVTFALAFSSFYELVEWWVVLLFYPESGPEWLGMQGDPWDAQRDMLMALLGAICAVTLMASLHERSLQHLHPGSASQDS